MNLNQLNQKLIAAARHQPPSDRVPYAFEKRIMAHLATCPVPDLLTLWGQALSRAAFSYAAVMLLIGASAFYLTSETPAGNPATGSELSQDLQDTLLAAVDLADQTEPLEPTEQIEEL
ncbi:MAG: hypothetical protein RJB55_2080 [Verrucomicrobiota bacterium]|jgi:hypothetical protein